MKLYYKILQIKRLIIIFKFCAWTQNLINYDIFKHWRYDKNSYSSINIADLQLHLMVVQCTESI